MGGISEESKLQRHRGKGEKGNYKPWILTRELNSQGTTANIIDWKHGREIQLLSAAEEMYYYCLRWEDNVVDIREQFPLDLGETVEIAERLGLRHPNNRYTRMTTDMLVAYEDGTYAAFSVKCSRKDMDYTIVSLEKEKRATIRTAEKLAIEKMYWQNHAVKWNLVFKEDLNPVYVDNIRRAVQYYDQKKVHDDISVIKHMIATKQIEVNMQYPLNYRGLANLYLIKEEDYEFYPD